jgi:hypothetical protein
MSVVLGELTVCVGDGANRFPDADGWEGRCPECLALWDDHAAGHAERPPRSPEHCRRNEVLPLDYFRRQLLGLPQR